MSEIWEARRELHDDPPRGGRPLPPELALLDIHNFSRLALCEICDEPLTEGQLRRGARFCSSVCRAKGHEARDPRLSNASIAQLEGELLKRLGRAAGGTEDKAVTVRALTRNVRVLKLTWTKVRSMTPSRSTFMQTLERIVHEAWVREGL